MFKINVGISLLAAVLALGGCAKFIDMMEAASPSSPQPPPEPEPAYRQLITENIREIFADATGIRELSVSPIRHIELAQEQIWRTCLKADTKDFNGQYSAPKTYIIDIQKNKIADRRPAQPQDGCQSEHYEKLEIANQSAASPAR